jgi:predicted PurR-regulated permease PerM
MALERHVVFWCAVLAGVIFLIWLLHPVLLPFVAGVALAYLLDPLANRIERLGVNRVVATFVMIVAFGVALVALAILIIPILAGQATALVEHLPGYSERVQAIITDPNRPWLSKLVGAGFPELQASTVVKEAAGASVVFLRSLWSGSQTVISVLSLFVVAPVVAFYLLVDWHRMIQSIDRWLPRDHADTIRMLARDIDRAIAGFVRGQTGVCLILGACYATPFVLIGLNFGLLIGIATGIASFIPYVGTLSGMLIALIVAVVQFWPNWTPILMVLAVGVVCAVLESYVLSPFFVGPNVGLHPVWMMFALFVFSYLFGFVGLIVAIPVAAAVGVLARFGLKQYLASRVYAGDRTS